MKLAQFYRSKKDFEKIHWNLKLTACPHCKRTGTLILHGYLFGYDLGVYSKRVLKGRRIFCSNRNRKQGCGKTFSVFKADRLKRFSIQTSGLWSFLKNIAGGMNLFQAFRSLGIALKTTSIYRLYNRIYLGQHKIRTLLLKRSPAPQDIQHKNPLIKTIAHLKLAFQGSADPLAAFQSTFQSSLL